LNSFRIYKTRNPGKLKYKKFLLETAGYWVGIQKEGDTEDEEDVERAPTSHSPYT
jgi:hypothetical protein